MIISHQRRKKESFFRSRCLMALCCNHERVCVCVFYCWAHTLHTQPPWARFQFSNPIEWKKRRNVRCIAWLRQPHTHTRKNCLRRFILYLFAISLNSVERQRPCESAQPKRVFGLSLSRSVLVSKKWIESFCSHWKYSVFLRCVLFFSFFPYIWISRNPDSSSTRDLILSYALVLGWKKRERERMG